MFKKLRDKISEEVQQTSIRLPVSVQQLSQLSPFNTSGGENSVSSKSPQNEPQDELLVDISEIQPAGDNKDLFSIDEDSGEGTPSKPSSAFHVVELDDALNNSSNSSPENAASSEQHVSDPFDPSTKSPLAQPGHQRRKSSEASEAGGLFPIYEVPGVSFGVPQSDLESCCSEWEDSAASVDRLSKDTVYQAYLRVRQRYHKYKGRYGDIVRAYQDKENETSKLRDVLTKTQDKAMRRVSELREQCSLEQQAKAHLEEELRSDLEERDHKISALQTKVRLLQEGYLNDANIKSAIVVNSQTENERHEDELNSNLQTDEVNAASFHSNDDGDNVSMGSLGSISTAPTSIETDELIEKLRGDLVKHKTLLSRCMENIRVNKEKMASLSNERDQSTKKFQELTDSVEVLKVEHAKELDCLRASVESSALSMAETKQQLFKELQTKEVEAELFKQRSAELELTIKSLQEHLEESKRDSADDEQEICIENKLEHSETTSELSLSFRESEFKCAELEKLVSELQDANKNLEFKADELNKKNLSFEEALKNQWNKEHSVDSNKPKEELNKLHDEKLKIEQTHRDTLAKLNTANLKSEELSVHLDKLKSDYDQLMFEKERLNEEMVLLSNAQVEKLQLNTEKINELIKENTVISNSRDNLSEQFDKFTKENADLTHALSTLQNDFDELKVQNDLLKEDNSALKNETSKKEELIESIKGDLVNKSSCLEKDLKNLEESFKTQIKDKDSHGRSLEKKLKKMSDENLVEKKSSQKLKVEFETLKGIYDERLAEIQKLNERLAEFSKNIQDKKENLDKKNIELSTLNEELTLAKNRQEESLAKLNEVGQNADHLEKINAKMKDSLAEHEKKIQLMNEMEKTIAALEEKVANLVNEKNEIGSESSSKISELEALLNEKSAKIQLINETSLGHENSIAKLEENVKRLINEKNETANEGSSKISELEALLGEKSNEIKRIKAEFDSLLEDVEKRGLSKEKKLKALSDNLTADKASLQSKVFSLEEEITTLHTVIEQNESFISSLKKGHEKELSDAREKVVKEWRTKLEELQAEHISHLASAEADALDAQRREAAAQFEKESERLCREKNDALRQLREESQACLSHAMEQQTQEHQREVEQLKAKLAEREKQLETQVHGMEESNADLRQRIESLQSEISEIEKNYSADVTKSQQRHEEEKANLQSKLESEKRSLEERLTAEKVVIEEQLTSEKQALQDLLDKERKDVESRTNTDIQSLTEKLSSLDLAHKALIDKSQELESKNGELRSTLSGAEEERNKLQNTLDLAQNEKSGLLNKEEELRQLSQDLENQVRTLQEENQRLTGEMTQTKELFNTERQQLQEEATNAKTTLQEVLARQQDGTTSAEAQSVIASLTQQIDSLKEEQVSYLAHIQELQANCSEATSKLNVTDQQKNELKINLEELTSSQQDSGTDEAKLTEKLSELEELIQTLRAENASLLQELEITRSSSSTEASATGQDASTARESESSSSTDLEQIERQKKSAEKSLAEERTMNETLRVECNFFKGEIERVRQSLISEQLSTESLRQENSTFKQQLETLQNSGNVVPDTWHHEELAERVRSLSEENQALINKNEGLKADKKGSEESSSLISQLQKEKDDLTSEKNVLQETKDNLEKLLNETKKEMSLMEENLCKNKSDESTQNERITSLTNTISDLQRKSEELLQTSNQSAVELVSARAKCGHFEEELERVSATSDSLQLELQEAQSKVASLSSQNSELSSKSEARDAQSSERVVTLERQIVDLQTLESSLKSSLEASKTDEASLRSSVMSLETSLNEEKKKTSQLEDLLKDMRVTCQSACTSVAEKEDSSYFRDVVLALSHQRDEITKQLSEELISKEQLVCQMKIEADKYNQLNSSLKAKIEEFDALSAKFGEYEEKYRLLSIKKDEAIKKSSEENSLAEASFKEKLKESETALASKHTEEICTLEKTYETRLREAEEFTLKKVKEAVKRREDELQHKMDQLNDEWNQERKELERLTQVATEAFKSGTESMDRLKKQVTSQRKEIDDMNHSHRKEVGELQALLEVKRRRAKGGTAASGDIRLAGALEDSAEFDYLRNILFQYMLGKETRTLCKVLCAVAKFDKDQQQQILEFEEQKQSLVSSLSQGLGFLP